jgi:hypothetical protein
VPTGVPESPPARSKEIVVKVQRMLLIAICLTLGACAGAATGSVAPSATPSESVAPSLVPSSPGIVLHHYPDNLACDAIGVDYKTMIFHIDPSAPEQVSALTDTGVTLVTHWPADFTVGSGAEWVVRDGAGNVIVTEGDVLKLGQGLPVGFGVCLTPAKLYVIPAGWGN